jgi:hypothetical protein
MCTCHQTQTWKWETEKERKKEENGEEEDLLLLYFFVTFSLELDHKDIYVAVLGISSSPLCEWYRSSLVFFSSSHRLFFFLYFVVLFLFLLLYDVVSLILIGIWVVRKRNISLPEHFPSQSATSYTSYFSSSFFFDIYFARQQLKIKDGEAISPPSAFCNRSVLLLSL